MLGTKRLPRTTAAQLAAQVMQTSGTALFPQDKQLDSHWGQSMDLCEKVSSPLTYVSADTCTRIRTLLMHT